MTCTRCPLHKTVTNQVVGMGNMNADIMLIGEAPGAKEDASGLPFQGMSGTILDLALKQAGLSRDDVYITNTVRCRPPGNRNPKVGEVTACKPNLQNVIDTVNPKIIVTVGLVSTKRFIPVKNMKDVVGHAHGNIVPMLHPASYLYSGRSPKVMDSMVLSLTLAQQTILQSSMPTLAQRH